MINGVAIQGFGYVYKDIANRLTEWENWRTDVDHESAVVAKTFAFEV